MFPKRNNVKTMSPVVASVHRLPAVVRPEGPYMTARQIVDEFFPGTGISPEWVTRNVPGRIKLGHRTVLWKRSAVVAWLEQLEAQH